MLDKKVTTEFIQKFVIKKGRRVAEIPEIVCKFILSK